MEIIPRRRTSNVSRPTVFQIFEDVHHVIRDSKVEISSAQSSNDELRLLLKNEKNIRKTAEARASDAQVKLDQKNEEIYWYGERINFLEGELQTVSLSRDALAEYITTALICKDVLVRDTTETVLNQSLPEETQIPMNQEGSQVESNPVDGGPGIMKDLESESPRTVGKIFQETDIVKDQIVKTLLEKIQKEQEKSFSLEDKISEMHENIEKERKRGDEMEKNFKKEKEYLEDMLKREKSLNKRISYEGDCAVEELQSKLREITEDRTRLRRSKEQWRNKKESNSKEFEIVGNKNTGEVTEGVYKNCNESSARQGQSSQEITEHDQHDNSHAQVNRTTAVSQSMYSNPLSNSSVTNQCTQTDVSISESLPSNSRNGSETKLRYGNVSYRTQLSQMIRDGLHWFCSMGNRAARANQAEFV